MGAKVNVWTNIDFDDHLNELLEEHKSKVRLKSIIPNYYYLLERSWYIDNPELQDKLLQVVNEGLGSKVNVISGDFKDHLDELLEEKREIIFEFFRTSIINFDYLTTRSWFMHNKELQERLLKIVSNGFGDKVDVLTSDNFTDHLNGIIENYVNQV